MGRRSNSSMPPSYVCRCARALLLLLVLAGPSSLLLLRPASAERVLKQVHVISRHGPNNYFDDSVHLTPFGKEQVRGLGLYLKEKYGKTVVLREGATHERDDVHFWSSSAGSAILSAQILAHVLFEGTAGTNDLPAVPVYSAEDENDVYIRPYNKCPEGLEAEIENLAGSSTWRELRNKHADLLSKLAEVPAFEDAADNTDSIPLENLFEIYDAIAVAKEECKNVTAADNAGNADADGNGTDADVNGTGTGTEANATGADARARALAADDGFCSEDQLGLVDVLTDEEWEELYKLAQTIELDKYDSEMAGRLGGINLWKEILKNVDNVKGTTNESDGLYVWSSHYETILTMFAAVREEVPRSGVNGSAAIPSYGAAIIVEAYGDNVTDEASVKVLYKDSGAAHSKTVPMAVCDGGDYCTFDALVALFKDFELEDWCDQCGNEESDVCMNLLLLKAESIGSGNDDRGSGSGSDNQTSTTAECPPATASAASGASAGAVVGTFFAGLAIGMFGMGWCCFRRHKSANDHASSSSAKMNIAYPPPERNLTDMTEVSLDNNGNYA
jgi:Histidine phosphatase superfamily (branch 2)